MYSMKKFNEKFKLRVGQSEEKSGQGGDGRNMPCGGLSPRGVVYSV